MNVTRSMWGSWKDEVNKTYGKRNVFKNRNNETQKDLTPKNTNTAFGNKYQ